MKAIVNKILKLKKSFQSKGIFHKIFENNNLSRNERRESMRILGLAGLRSDASLDSEFNKKSYFGRNSGKNKKNNFIHSIDEIKEEPELFISQDIKESSFE